MTQNNEKLIPCTVGIIAFNNELTLRKCLESVKSFSEIILCDGGSTDNTLKIAEEYGCIIIKQSAEFKNSDNTIADFSGVRNQTFYQASYEWFLYVDTDEYLSEAVAGEVADIIENDTKNSPKVYKMPRKFVIAGNIIDCASVYPNYHTRFFHRDYVDSFLKKVHEKPDIKSGTKVSHLKKPTYVPIEIDYEEDKKKHNYYLGIERGRHKSFAKFQLLQSLKNTARSIIVRCIKAAVSFVFCRGRRIPLRKELVAIRYSLKLTLIILLCFINE